MKAYLCVHRSALKIPDKYYKEFPIQTKEKWRIRDLKYHPRDPGWESSRYCRCHSVMRIGIAKRFKEEEIYVLDLVYIKSKKHVIRSMFQIRDTASCQFDRSTQDLLFSDYYFAPKNKSKISYIQEFPELSDFKCLRGIKILDENISKKIVKKIKKTYEHIDKGKKPSTIDPKDWRFYHKHLGIQHVCK